MIRIDFNGKLTLDFPRLRG